MKVAANVTKNWLQRQEVRLQNIKVWQRGRKVDNEQAMIFNSLIYIFIYHSSNITCDFLCLNAVCSNAKNGVLCQNRQNNVKGKFAWCEVSLNLLYMYMLFYIYIYMLCKYNAFDQNKKKAFRDQFIKKHSLRTSHPLRLS